MSYHIVTRWGDSESVPSESRMREVLRELDAPDMEHPDCWLTHESGWTLSVFEGGLLVWENPESDAAARHQVHCTKEKALTLWMKLARGEIAAIDEEPWQQGHSPPRSVEEQARLVKESEEATRFANRKFYDSLGPEQGGVRCQHAGCSRGSVRFSLFCRVHHYENVRHRPCPFTD